MTHYSVTNDTIIRGLIKKKGIRTGVVERTCLECGLILFEVRSFCVDTVITATLPLLEAPIVLCYSDF
jgi:hypothetical protein